MPVALALSLFESDVVERAFGVDEKTIEGSRQRLEFGAPDAVEQDIVDRAAERADARGQESAKAGALGAYTNQLRAQSGKSITAERAAFLISLVPEL